MTLNSLANTGKGDCQIVVLANSSNVEYFDPSYTGEEEVGKDMLYKPKQRGVEFLACENAIKEYYIN